MNYIHRGETSTIYWTEGRCKAYIGVAESGYEKEIRQTIHFREVFSFYQRKIITTPINICPKKQIKKAYLQQEKESRTCGSQQRRKFIIFKFLLNNHAFIQEDIYNTKSILSLWGTELKYLTLYINLKYCNTVGLLNSSITWR